MSGADPVLCALSATQAHARFRDGSLSPVELLEALIARAEAVEPVTNALCFRHFDVAMDAARMAQARFARGTARVLEGVPIAIKDSSKIAGMPNSMGSLIFKDHVAQTTSVVNRRVIDAGGIVHARSAMPEFGCAPFTYSRLWGVTRNPWNPACTPGGSSGGAGACLAAGTATLATGSDIGGSIRIPASCCGVVGYKPPHGRNPMEPPLNLDPYCHAGPMARSVADTLLLQNVMSGPHPEDIASLRPKVTLSGETRSLKGWKIAVTTTLGFFEIDPAVRANTQAALAVFRDLGAEIRPVDLPWDWDVLDAATAHLVHVFANTLSPLLKDHADQMTDYARGFAQAGLQSTPRAYLSSMEKAAAMGRDLGPVLEAHDLLICPTLALPAVPAEFDPLSEDVRINGRAVPPFTGWYLAAVFNMLSRCPVLSVPSGIAPNGVPTGIQIVGRTFADQSVFTAGLAYEAACGPWITPETLPPVRPSGIARARDGGERTARDGPGAGRLRRDGSAPQSAPGFVPGSAP